MGKLSDQNKQIMYELWKTDKLVTDYQPDEKQNLLREINHDNHDHKMHNFKTQSNLHQKIRNDHDYDDWEYGTEPIPLTDW